MTTTTIVHISYDEAVELLDRAVAEKGEHYVYPLRQREWGCIYFTDDNQPSCIVGQVLSYKGLDPQLIRDQECNGIGISSVASALLDVLDLEAKAVYLFAAVQTRQDSGVPWGKAVAEAKAETAEMYPA